ncbi:hypothetical protein [Zunongwangia sp.]|uniref:hypothetical protein n=1 Tax=Zunongwangia sp. TaxID=1965325 RepID=UPI003AA85318
MFTLTGSSRFVIDAWKNSKTEVELAEIWNEIINMVKSDNFVMPVKAEFKLSEFKNAISAAKDKEPGKVLFSINE